MKTTEDGRLLRVHINEANLWFGKPLHEAIVRRFHQEGIGPCRVFKGIDGAISLEMVDTEANALRAMPILDEMVTDGAITVTKVEMTRYSYKRPR